MTLKVLSFLLAVFWGFCGNAQKNSYKTESDFIEAMKYYNAGEYSKAIEIFKGINKEVKNSDGVNFMLARSYTLTDDFNNALPYAEKAYDLVPSSVSYKEILAQIYTKQKKYKDAERMLKKLIEQNPSISSYYIELANLHLQESKYADATKVYQELEKHIDFNEEIAEQKQLMYFKQKQVDKAFKEGSRIVSHGSSKKKLAEQTQLLIENGRYEQAVLLLKDVIKQNPNYGEAHVLLSDIYRRQGKTKECNEELTLVFENPSIAIESKIKILVAHTSDIDNTSSSIEELIMLGKKLESQSQDGAVYLVLGKLWHKKGNIAEARNYYLKAVASEPTFNTWVSVLEMDRELKDFASLTNHAEQAMEYFPTHAFFWYQQGVGYFEQKNYKEAQIALEEAAKLVYENDDLALHIKDLLKEIKSNN